MVSTTKIISTKTVMLGQFEDLRVLREENLKATKVPSSLLYHRQRGQKLAQRTEVVWMKSR